MKNKRGSNRHGQRRKSSPFYSNSKTRHRVNIITGILVAVVIILLLSILIKKRDNGHRTTARDTAIEKTEDRSPAVRDSNRTQDIRTENVQEMNRKEAASGQAEKSSTSIHRSAPARIRNLEIPAKLTDRREEIIKHLGYTVSFNEKTGLPNWVAYELNSMETEGIHERSGRFRPDPMVSGRCPDHDDYTHSGYDRGHMAPAADMKWSKAAMEESFYMTNICPQNHKLNSGVWLAYEERGRMWAAEKDIYIVCGPVVSKMPKRIGDYEVAVPDAFYKIFLKEKNGTYTALAILCPNIAERKKMRDYVVSIDYIEEMTGIDFFPALPDSTEMRIEAATPCTQWGIR